MAQVLELNHERAERVRQDEAKAKLKKTRRLQRMKQAERNRRVVMGLAAGGSSDEGGEEVDGDEKMAEDGEEDEEEDEDELSSSTDELTPSD